WFFSCLCVAIKPNPKLDSSWTWFQLRCMQVGSNANAIAFFRQHGCTTTDASAKYNSRAAQTYREKIRQLASAAMAKYGNDLLIDGLSGTPGHSPEKSDADFFLEHTQVRCIRLEIHFLTGLFDCLSGSSSDHGPSIDLLSTSPKGPLVLFMLSAFLPSFTEIERQAQVAEKLKEVASMRLAYQELQIDRKKEEKKLQNLEGKKREQAERLGMGLVSRSSISHSVLSEMQVIEQETPVTAKSTRSQLDLFEDTGSFTSGPPKYKDNPFSLGDAFSSQWETDNSSWGMDKGEEEADIAISSIRPINRRETESKISVVESNEARQKFAGAKAISSDMFFGREADAEYEARSRLQQLSGSNAISSADLFGESEAMNSGGVSIGNVLPAADIAQFKQGVKSVAGKMAVLANGVMNSLQVRYGEILHMSYNIEIYLN
uniref:Uncharacterized protein n=1 Tax=Anolis carolinensis TaxID=28377 RepID=G1KBP9_ANOCA